MTSIARSDPSVPVWLLETVTAGVKAWVNEKRNTDFWRDPLVGVAAADDPLLPVLREAVDPEHAMPQDLLPGAQTVITFFFPFKREVGRENNVSGDLAGQSWVDSYVSTNALIAETNARIQEQIAARGFQCALTPATHNFDPQKLVSLWSHRHLAYIAGLGTFGHNNLLITAAGCCGRYGSLTTDMPLPPTPRPDGEHCRNRLFQRNAG